MQGFEYTAGNCGGKPQRPQPPGVDGERDILCLQSAICMPVADNAPAEPPTKTVAELVAAQMSGVMKPFMLVCLGKGKVVAGQLNVGSCPSPSHCRNDLFYGFAPVGMAPMIPQGVTTPMQQKGDNEKSSWFIDLAQFP